MAPFFPGRTIKCMQQTAQSLTILKPLATIMLLYLGIIPRNSDFSVIAWSLILPVYAFETNVIAKFGTTQTKNLSVL